MLSQQISAKAPWEQFFPVSVYDYIECITLNLADEDFELRRLFRAGLDWKISLPDLREQVLECVRENYIPTIPHWPEGWEGVLPDLVEKFVGEVIADWQTHGCPLQTEEEKMWADEETE